MEPRTVRLELPTGRRVEVRADLSVRVMLRTRLIQHSDELALLDALDGVIQDDRALGWRLQDAIVMHALDTLEMHDLHGLSEDDFRVILGYAVDRLAAQPEEAEDADEEQTASEEEEGESLEDEPQMAFEDLVEATKGETLPSSGLPVSAQTLDAPEADDGE